MKDYPSEIYIRKASGEEELFNIHKLEKSLHNAGADRASIKSVLKNIEEWIFPGVSTKQIYSRAFSLLRKGRTHFALRYKLKKALLQLGPTGYPFEAYVGQLFEHQGYQCEVGIDVEGNCLTHEMDVIATKAPIQHIMECKYHKDQGKTVSIQVPLYVRSRVNDIIEKREKMPEFEGLRFQAWVVTNTRFSSDSIQYGRCKNVNLLAWDYPYGHGLKDMIERERIYPITILSHLIIKEKQSLMEQGIVTCSQLLANIKALDPLNLSSRKHKELLKELQEICA